MKIRLEDIGAEGKEETFIQDNNWLDERLAGEVNRRFHFIEPIKIRVTLSRSGRNVILKSRIETRVEWLCDRCLEPFSRGLRSEFITSLKPKLKLTGKDEDWELKREDLETEFYEGEEFDLTPLIQDQVILTLPPKAICNEGCRGLCPRCGKNLNRDLCQCPEKVIDPRLEPLKGFRVR